MSDMPNEKVLDKVRKLLALSTSPNEAEAASAYEKAHAMLKAYNLSVADITEKPDVIDKIVLENNKEEHWKRMLLNAIAKANYCALIILKDGAKFRYKVFGREANIATTMTMFDYLQRTVRRISVEASKKFEGHFSMIDFRKSMVQRLRDRIEAEMMQESSCTALVLVNTEAREALVKAHPDRVNTHSHIRPSASAMLGRMMADSIGLHRQVPGTGA